jgi:hypothetical protein
MSLKQRMERSFGLGMESIVNPAGIQKKTKEKREKK